MTRLLRAGCLISACLTAGGCSRPAAPPADPAQRVEWPAWGNDPGGQRYSPLETINPGNVSRLRPAWEWVTGERIIPAGARLEEMHPDKFETTPVMLGDTLYLTTPFNRAIALDAESGRELWRFDPGATDSGRIGGDPSGFVHRGMAVWTGPNERRVILASRWRLFALDAATGRPIPGFGAGGAVDLTPVAGGPQRLRQHVAAFDLRQSHHRGRLGGGPAGLRPGPARRGEGLRRDDRQTGLALGDGAARRGETLYAMSTGTGAVLWSAPLHRIGYANPMTYRTARGRQYVVIATGIREGARLRAFALPDEER